MTRAYTKTEEPLAFSRPFRCQKCDFVTMTSGMFVEHMLQFHAIRIEHGDIEAIEERWRSRHIGIELGTGGGEK